MTYIIANRRSSAPYDAQTVIGGVPYLHSRPPQCYHFAGWINYPLKHDNNGGNSRIRHMCKHKLVYPCAYYDGTGWHNASSSDPSVAKYDGWTGSRTTTGGTGVIVTNRVCPGNGDTDIPSTWPWIDTRKNCWSIPACKWFVGNITDCPDALIESIGSGILALMQSTDDDRSKRGHRTESYDIFPWSCFSCHVQQNALVSIMYQADVYQEQDKVTKAYMSYKNVWVNGYVSVCIPVAKC